MKREDLALLLQFTTGTSSVPLGGFADAPIKIMRHTGSTDRMPNAHTCFNQLDMPEYMSKRQLRERLLVALRDGATGFGFS